MRRGYQTRLADIIHLIYSSHKVESSIALINFYSLAMCRHLGKCTHTILGDIVASY